MQEFIEKVNPQIALIGVGENNTFGHPSDNVLERLKAIGVKIYRTDVMGEITINVTNKSRIRIEKFIK